MSVKPELLETLEHLGDEDLKKFKWFLQQPHVLGGLHAIPKCQLENADRMDTVDRITDFYGQTSEEVVKKILEKIQRAKPMSSSRTGAGETNRVQNKYSASEEILPRLSVVKASENVLIINIGEKDPSKTNKTILLVGETGAGKSTLINTLVNYAMGVKWEDDVWFQIVKEDKRTSQCESQTSDVIVYQIFGFEDETLPYSLTIIDTPGYGDTRGTEQDEIVSQRLLDWFGSDDGVHEINAVGLVLKATENRVSERQSYIFDSVLSLFGKNMEKNIVALITHSDGLTPENVLQALKDANIKCAKDEDNEPVHFLFNNRQNTRKTKKNKVALKSAWDISMEGMSQFTDFLKETPPKNLITTVDVLKERIRLKACIQNLQERVEFIEKKQKEIKQTQEDLKKHKDEMKKNENFTVEVDEPYKAKQTIDGGTWGFMWNRYKGATCCLVCEETCHYPGCVNAQYAKDCEVMKDGHCTVCTKRCSASVHVKERWIYVNKTRKVQEILPDMKKKYEEAKSDCEKTTKLLEDLGQKMKELQKDKDHLLEESFLHVVKLEQIALNVDSLSTQVHLDFLIEKMKEKGDKEKVQKLEERKSRVDERARVVLRYVWKTNISCKR